MTILEDELTIVQERLHDNEALWTREELLRWYNDGYRQMVAESQAVRRFFFFDVPPRSAWAGSFDWEDRHGSGTFRKFTKTAFSGQWEVSYDWEVEYLEGATPTSSAWAVTQLWERGYLDEDIAEHYRFALDKSHERIHRVAWDDRRLQGISAKELDLLESRWWLEEGEPDFWLRGVGRDLSFEVYQTQNGYAQAYGIADDNYGLPRFFDGARDYAVLSTIGDNDYAYTNFGNNGMTGLGWRFTVEATGSIIDCVFAWEKEMDEGETDLTDETDRGTYGWEVEFGAGNVSFGIGALRAVLSSDRQYLPMAHDTGEFQILGAARDFGSSIDAISTLESIVHTRELTEVDAPWLVPQRLWKYLRCYAWGCAFGREGEGQKYDLAAHYMKRFRRGVEILKLIGNLTALDRNYGRDEFPRTRGAPPRVRLPSTFPRVEI